MRIAFITETWRPSVDGVVRRLEATIGELRGAGHEVLVVAPRRSGRHMVGVTVVGLPTIGFQFLYGGKRWGLPTTRVARVLRRFAPDVVHVLNPVLLGVAGVLAARCQERALVASYHTDLSQYAAHYRLGWIVPLLWAHQRRLHRAAHLNLATSTAAANQLTRHGIEAPEVWPRGIDLVRFHPNSTNDGDAGRAAGHPPTALYVGRLATEKGLHRLAPLARPNSTVRLTLTGDGPARSELRQRFGEGVTFTGTLHGPALTEAYSTADVFVFPSTTDTLGLVLLEALASGLPVVAADTPASRETLADCPAARLFPAEHPEQLPTTVHELLASAPQQTLARQARHHAARWSWQEATTHLLTCYHAAHRRAGTSMRATRPGPRRETPPPSAEVGNRGGRAPVDRASGVGSLLSRFLR